MRQLLQALFAMVRCSICHIVFVAPELVFQISVLAFQEEQNVTCNNGAVRLADGLTEYEGRVEICYDNHWGAVCGNSWNENEASVVCRQLGHISVGEKLYTATNA